jgi:hypothetical protein
MISPEDSISKITWNAKTANLVSPQLIGLATGWNLSNSGRESGNKTPSHGRCSGATRVVAVQQQNDFMKVPLEKLFLVPRHRAPHQGHNAGQSSLMHLEAIEETLYDNGGPTLLGRSVKIEEHQRLSKERRKLVLRLGILQRPAGIGD